MEIYKAEDGFAISVSRKELTAIRSVLEFAFFYFDRSTTKKEIVLDMLISWMTRMTIALRE